MSSTPTQNRDRNGEGAWRRQAMVAWLLLSLVGVASANMSYNRPWYETTGSWKMTAQDENLFFSLSVDGDEFQNFQGTGTMTIWWDQVEVLESFSFGFVESVFQFAGSMWSSSFNPNTGIMTIEEDLGTGWSVMDFTFDPTNVVLSRTDLQYQGQITAGTLTDIDTLSIGICTVPIPSTFLLSGLGLGLVNWRWRRRRTF